MLYFATEANMQREFTAVIEKRGRWYVAYVEEIPGVNTQGRTLSSARRNLRERPNRLARIRRKKELNSIGAVRTVTTHTLEPHLESCLVQSDVLEPGAAGKGYR